MPPEGRLTRALKQATRAEAAEWVAVYSTTGLVEVRIQSVRALLRSARLVTVGKPPRRLSLRLNIDHRPSLGR